MGSEAINVGQSNPLMKSLRKAVATMAIASALTAAAWLGTADPLSAAGETRTISFYHVHTKESITVTYKQNGRFVPSAMKKVNYILRDWRRNATTTIDPKTLDLVWELHADLGSNRPVHIVSGFRSAKTNAFLKRSGRNVAKKSQHIKGKAIDFYFPDVPTIKIRNSALVRRVGGVGYYRSSGGPTGFLHVDSGNVRHWGPAISRGQWASIMREGKKTVGRRIRNGGSSFAGSAETESEKKGGLFSGWFGGKNKSAEPEIAPPPTVADEEEIEAPNYTGFDEDLTDLVADASKEPKKKVKPVPQEVVESDEEQPAIVAVKAPPKTGVNAKASAELASLAQTAATEGQAEEELVGEAPAEIKRGKPIPKPRLKPAEVINLAMADANQFNITPTAAQPDAGFNKKPAKASTKVLTAVVAPDEIEAADEDIVQTAFANEEDHVTSKDGKSDFAAEIRKGNTDEVPLMRPNLPAKGDLMVASAVVVDVETLVRQNGAPPSLDSDEIDVMPKAAVLDDVPSANTEGKGDMLVVNREGKGNMEEMPSRLAGEKLGMLDQ